MTVEERLRQTLHEAADRVRERPGDVTATIAAGDRRIRRTGWGALSAGVALVAAIAVGVTALGNSSPGPLRIDAGDPRDAADTSPDTATGRDVLDPPAEGPISPSTPDTEARERATFEPTATDEALIAAFLRFAAEPTDASAADLRLGDEVALGLADDLLVTRSPTELADPGAWSLDVELFRGYVGPFSAVELVEGRSPTDTVVSLGEHPHCASPPRAAPAELASHRRVSVQPAPDTVDSCLAWWTVDLFVADDGTVAAITLDLYEP